jgi:thioredoxin reductase (NADPH)
MSRPSYTRLPDPMPPEQAHVPADIETAREVIIVGGGLAGLSAAIYLGRALRDVLIIDAGESLALWEPEIQNYLGFPDGISGRELLERSRAQAKKFGAESVSDEIVEASQTDHFFRLRGREKEYRCRKLLLATGVYHLPPKIPEADPCIGKSMFFCKDCDGYRIQEKRVAVLGANEMAVRYALGLLTYTNHVTLLTNGEKISWSPEQASRLREFCLPVIESKISHTRQKEGFIERLDFENGPSLHLDCLFTTRGDVFHNSLARQLGARLDTDGQVCVDPDMRTSVAGLYAAGCVTPANCQMIIAAGQGATAAQAINADLFDECLASGELRQRRCEQLPAIANKSAG